LTYGGLADLVSIPGVDLLLGGYLKGVTFSD
jgi:hypothetical protein